MTAVTMDMVGGMGEIVLTQGDRGSPFDDISCRELCNVANRVSEDDAIRAVLIRAEGRLFSVGVDLEWLTASVHRVPLLLKQATSDLHIGDLQAGAIRR